jgi:anti-sigma B factor antagonist
MLRFTTNEADGVLVVTFEATDATDSDWQATQRDWLYTLIDSRQEPRFAINLSEISYLASSEIGFLVTLKRRIDRRGGRMVFFGASPYIVELFRAMNLLRLMDLVDDLPSALAKLAAPAA